MSVNKSRREPELQNIPVKSELWRKIRQAFQAPSCSILTEINYSELELRVMKNMGLFSQDCTGCGHSIRHYGSCTQKSRWMYKAVALTPNGSILIGDYDGYGRLEVSGDSTVEDAIGFTNDVWHQVCWNLSGKPSYKKASRSSNDQGHFVGEYDPPEPTKLEHLVDLRIGAIKRGKGAA